MMLNVYPCKHQMQRKQCLQLMTQILAAILHTFHSHNDSDIPFFIDRLSTNPDDPNVCLSWLQKLGKQEQLAQKLEEVAHEVFLWVISYVSLNSDPAFCRTTAEISGFVLAKMKGLDGNSDVVKALYTKLLLSLQEIELPKKQFAVWKQKRNQLREQVPNISYQLYVHLLDSKDSKLTCFEPLPYGQCIKRIKLRCEAQKDTLKAVKHAQNKLDRKNARKKWLKKAILDGYQCSDLESASDYLEKMQELFMSRAMIKIANLAKISQTHYESEQVGDELKIFSSANTLVKETAFGLRSVRLPPQDFQINIHTYPSKLQSFGRLQMKQLEEEWELREMVKGLSIKGDRNSALKNYLLEGQIKDVEPVSDEPVPPTKRLIITKALVQNFLLNHYDWIFAAEKSLYKLP